MRVLVIGASVRAAADSLRRAGCEPVAFDLYHDADLAATADATQLDAADYPDRIAGRIAHLDPIPWLYTGAIENYPHVIAAIRQHFPLLGNAGAPLRAVRDPFRLAAMVRAANLLMPAVRDASDQVPNDGSWLVKPFISGGGLGISPWLGGVTPASGQFYYQERVVGLPLSALFIRDGEQTHLVGLTRQYVGTPSNRFAYRGSIGPWPIQSRIRLAVIKLGTLVGQAGLVGLFGLDLIVRADQVWLIEVNPRYTAAVEVLEAALGQSILAWHFRACDPTWDRSIEPDRIPPSAPVVGKAILFARSSGYWAKSVPVGTLGVADIPKPGTNFEPGHPILTVYATGNSIKGCRNNLARQLWSWRNQIVVARGDSQFVRPGY